MSRIHEALKKAGQERSSRISSGAAPDVLDVSTDVCRTTTLPLEDRALPLPDGLAPQQPPFLCIEELMKKCAHPRWQPDSRDNVFLGADGPQTDAESFRTLRSRLFQIAGTRQMKRVLVTSSIPAEGKTFVAANLAQAIVRQGKHRVLLIDADLRVSRLHQVLGAPVTPGLSDYLRGEADETAVIQRGFDGNLFLIAGGSPVTNPSELLLGERMKNLLERVTPVFDWLVIDSPPALPVHDASILADFCDGVLFVVRAGATSFELAEKASSEFRDKNLLGVVLNRADKNESYYSYYYNYGMVEENKT
jgi:protein-tyrosine kinase